jgi:biotin transport system substrate-specific component
MITLVDAFHLPWRRGYAPSARPARVSTASLLFHEAILVLAGSALIAASAWIAVPLPFSPVPVTAQTFAVLLVGSVLGARRGAAAAIAYLGEGSLGLPVFAGGSGGVHALAGPTGGYLAGFVAGAWLCGLLAERGWDRRVLTTVVSMALGNVAILAPGLLWLSRFVGTERVLALGLVPFLPGDVVKIASAAVVLPLGWKVIARLRAR